MGAFQWGLTIKLKLFAVLSALVFFFTANSSLKRPLIGRHHRFFPAPQPARPAVLFPLGIWNYYNRWHTRTAIHPKHSRFFNSLS
jgi:hypothetical protein